jgi:hypothetical protein
VKCLAGFKQFTLCPSTFSKVSPCLGKSKRLKCLAGEEAKGKPRAVEKIFEREKKAGQRRLWERQERQERRGIVPQGEINRHGGRRERERRGA